MSLIFSKLRTPPRGFHIASLPLDELEEVDRIDPTEWESTLTFLEEALDISRRILNAKTDSEALDIVYGEYIWLGFPDNGEEILENSEEYQYLEREIVSRFGTNFP